MITNFTIWFQDSTKISAAPSADVVPTDDKDGSKDDTAATEMPSFGDADEQTEETPGKTEEADGDEMMTSPDGDGMGEEMEEEDEDIQMEIDFKELSRPGSTHSTIRDISRG